MRLPYSLDAKNHKWITTKKLDPYEKGRVLKRIIPNELLNALLRELSPASCALTSFELRVSLTDYVKCAVALYNLAVFVAALH